MLNLGRVATAASALLADRGRGNAQVERRAHKRQVAMLRVALFHANGAKDICIVKNISATGLSACLYRKLACGDDVQVEFRSGELLSGSIVWERDWEVGISFPNPIHVPSVLASRWITETGRQRNLPRIELSCPGRVKIGADWVEVTLRDISQGGARVQLATQVGEMAEVILNLPELNPMSGVVRWSDGNELGISFNGCMAFEHLARWIQARRTQPS
jgi:PilZ domain